MANVLPGGTNGFYAGAGATGTGPTSGFYSTATQPIASAAPVTSSGVNPTTGGYYSKIQPTPPAGSAGAGGATLAPYTPTTIVPADPTNPNSGTYQPGTYSNTGEGLQNDYSGSIYAGNGTFGALGTDAPTGGIGNTSGAGPGAAPPSGTGTGTGTTTGTGTGSGGSDTGVLSGPGYAEANFAAHGNDLSGPSNSQSLYDQGVSATNPYYQHAMDVTNQGIDLAEAARGEGNSGAALAEIGSADAALSGQQALAQEGLAGQADTANTGQFTAQANAAVGAENQTNNRVNSATSAYTGLSGAQANLVDNFYNMAQTGQLTTDMAGIEAQLAASGVDAATAQAITNDILSAAGTAVKATSGK